MKNVNLILVAIILAGVFYLSFTEKSPAKPEGGEYELMYVQMTNIYGIFTFEQGKEPAFIAVPLKSSKKNLIENCTQTLDHLQKLYDEGWEIESTPLPGELILKRKK